MASSSRHLYAEWLRPRDGRVRTAAGRPDRQDDGSWRVWQWLRAVDRRYSLVVDLVLAAGLFVLCSGWVVARHGTHPSLLLAAALIFPLVLRRRAPMTIFLVVAAVAFVQWIVTGPALADVALLVALYTVALESDWRLVTAAAVILEAGVVMATARWDPVGNNVQSFVFLTGLAFTALLAGVVVRALRSRLDWLAERAQRLELERDQQASLAAAAERARIAREMHDVVSHNIQVMVTLADAASLAQASDPARAAEAVREVSSTGRQALTDMRRMLGVLRDEPAPAAADGPESGAGGNGRARRAGARHRSGRLGAVGRRTLRALERGRAHRLPRGAGGADQRVEARGGAHFGGGAADLRRSRPRRPRHRRRPGPGHRTARAAGRRPRAGRYGRTGHVVRGDAAGRPAPHGGLGSRGRPARLQCAHPPMTIRVVLADDQALLRKGFRMILEAEDDMEIVGEAPDGADAVRLVELYRPDVVLMDVRMPVLDGIEATRAITDSAAGAETRVLILTTFDLDEYAFSALRAGASGFLLKDVPPAELIAAMRTVARGDAVVSPRITRRLLEEYAHTLPDLAAHGADGEATGEHPALASLTEREREVLLAVADGLSNAEIAERLYVSEATVKSHVGRLLAKLGLRDRVQVVVFAFQSGLVRP